MANEFLGCRTSPPLPAHMRTPSPARSREVHLELSVVVPVFHNAASLEEMYQRLNATMQVAAVVRWDVTFVDDGSRDGSAAVLERLRQHHGNVRVLQLSRNFGGQAAVAAGLQHARGRAVAVLAADLQDPPEMLALMLQRWRDGCKVVLASRQAREDPWLTRVCAWLFYRVFRLLVTRDMPVGGFDFYLLDQSVAALLVKHAEKHTNISAAILWLGFERAVLPYRRVRRRHGVSMWTFSKKFTYMLDSVLSFSYRPLRVVVMLGVFALVACLFYGGVVCANGFANHAPPPVWATLILMVLFFNGVTLISIGLVGEYVWRAFEAARSRPGFVIAACQEPTGQVQTPREGRSLYG